MKFKNHFNRAEFPSRYEINPLPSMTIPDQTMSLQEILLKHSRGLPLTAVKVPIYEGDENLHPELSKMDIVDRHLYVERMQEELAELKIQLNQKADDLKVKRKAQLKADNEQKERDRKKQKDLEEGLDRVQNRVKRQPIEDSEEDSQQ